MGIYKQVNDPLAVVWRGVPRFRLNSGLVGSQNLLALDIEAIKELHKTRLDIIEAMEKLNPTTEIDVLVSFALLHLQNQYDLQKSWKFSLDHNFHDWYEVPHCSCPKMDNAERKGSGYKIVSGACPIHTSNQWLEESLHIITKREGKQ